MLRLANNLHPRVPEHRWVTITVDVSEAVLGPLHAAVLPKKSTHDLTLDPGSYYELGNFPLSYFPSKQRLPSDGRVRRLASNRMWALNDTPKADS